MKRLIFIGICAAVCVGISLLVFVSAKAAFVGRVVAEVTDSNGKPVSGAAVELWSVVPGPPRSETRSDEKTTGQNGTVEFTLVKAGTYLVRVLCPNGDYLPTDDEDHDFIVKSKTIYQQFECNPSGGAKANTGKNTRITPDGSIKVVQTGDWQPGDEVSFYFTGTVYGPAAEKQTQEDYSGSIVGIVDSQGNKTEVPWSKLIKYTVPAAATSVVAKLLKPDGTIIASTNIPVHPNGTPLPIQLPRKITGDSVAHPVSQIGEPYKIYSPTNAFSGDANKISLRTRNKLDNTITESNAVAASPRTAMFVPQIKSPGFFEFTVTDEGRFEESFDVSAVGIKLDTSRAYRVNQKGTLEVIVALPPQAYAQQELLAANFKTTIEMETPAILNFANGQNPVVWQLQKSEIDKNQARREFSVKSGTTGTFRAIASVATPVANNADGEPPVCSETGKLEDLGALAKVKVVKLCQLAYQYVIDHDPQPGTYFFIGLQEYKEEFRGEMDKDHVIWVHFKCHRYKCEK